MKEGDVCYNKDGVGHVRKPTSSLNIKAGNGCFAELPADTQQHTHN